MNNNQGRFKMKNARIYNKISTLIIMFIFYYEKKSVILDKKLLIKKINYNQKPCFAYDSRILLLILFNFIKVLLNVGLNVLSYSHASFITPYISSGHPSGFSI